MEHAWQLRSRDWRAGLRSVALSFFGGSSEGLKVQLGFRVKGLRFRVEVSGFGV